MEDSHSESCLLVSLLSRSPLTAYYFEIYPYSSSSRRLFPLRKALADTTIELQNNIYHRALDWNRVQAPIANLDRKLEAVNDDPANNDKACTAASKAEHNALFPSAKHLQSSSSAK